MTDLATARLVLDALALYDARDLFAVRGDPAAMAFWRAKQLTMIR